jgi:phage tail sheath protein FI
LGVPITADANSELNRLGVNCLRSFPAVGHVVFGARTLQGDDRLSSEWKFIPVRRTALFIEESLDRGLRWTVFEANGEPLWARIRSGVDTFMLTLFRDGAFQGTKPQEAYFVKCGRDTTSDADIDVGVIYVVVGFAPLKRAEFVIITLRLLVARVRG